MRKRVIFLSFIAILFIAFSSFAFSYYYSTPTIVKGKTLGCTKPNNSETLFESIVKQLVGAVITGR